MRLGSFFEYALGEVVGFFANSSSGLEPSGEACLAEAANAVAGGRAAFW